MSLLSILLLFVTTILLASLATTYRLLNILNPSRPKPLRHGRRNPQEPTHLLIVLGSGGHTAEMISLLTRATASEDSGSESTRLDWRDYTHRTWVVSSGDAISAERARAFEDAMAERISRIGESAGRSERDKTLRSEHALSYEICTVPRARAIHQPLLTTPRTALQCLFACFAVLIPSSGPHQRPTSTTHNSKEAKDFPDLILSNGPATATILIFASVILRFVDYQGCNARHRMRTVYVESWARVNRLSLSGRLLCRVVDRFLVQWPQLDSISGEPGGQNGRAEFVGVLV